MKSGHFWRLQNISVRVMYECKANTGLILLCFLKALSRSTEASNPILSLSFFYTQDFDGDGII